MINLMPPDKKEVIWYARRNSILIKWGLGIAVAGFGVLLVAAGGLFYLEHESKSYQKSINTTKDRLKQQNEEATLKRSEEMKGNLQLAVDVLSKEILFSKLLTQIGKAIPQGTVLEKLNLTSDLQGGLDISIGAVSYQSGVQAQVNLADSENGIFDKADLGAVTCESDDTTGYPCTATIRALFSKNNNEFLKLNQGGQ
jgi:Tfp pilus assembly protein PilN